MYYLSNTMASLPFCYDNVFLLGEQFVRVLLKLGVLVDDLLSNIPSHGGFHLAL